MHKRTFLKLAVGGALLTAGGAGYLLSDKAGLQRSDTKPGDAAGLALQPDEREILTLASLAPSGHNTQPWLIDSLEPFHWIVGNDRARWLPAVDPRQRETMLSLGAFLQNLEYAASELGYSCRWTLLAATPQDERVMEVQLRKTGARTSKKREAMEARRTLRGSFELTPLRKEDLAHLVAGEEDFIHYLPSASNEAGFLREQTVEANRLQVYRDPAQRELEQWIRFSSEEAAKHRDGLTTAGMEIEGLTGWFVRNFYDGADVFKKSFRERSLAKVRTQVAGAAGWILITSEDERVESLLETGRRMQRLFLKVRARELALHPMTQILEEPSTSQSLYPGIGFSQNIQFILRVGYVAHYPLPVSPRRPFAWFLRKG